MRNAVLTIACTVFLFSCSSTVKQQIVTTDITTKYDMSVKGFSKDAVKGMIDELAKLTIYIKHNVLEMKENTSTITYTAHDDGRNIPEITKVIEESFNKQGLAADVYYSGGMFKINNKN